jgi:glycosyltransferase involved in cell wall biosynthesis
MTPLLSVVIPLYNAEHEIRMCLDSIFQNTWPHFEVIVVDDGSTDNSLAVVRQYDCRIVSSGRNMGPARARNLGVTTARADLILFLDSDTKLPADALEMFYDAFQAQPDILAVIAVPAVTSLRKGRAPDYNALRNHFSLVSADPITDYFTTQMGAIRKGAFCEAGGFSEEYTCADIEDFELGLRLPPNKVFIHKGIVIGHHFPPLGSILRKYMRRASLLAQLMRKRKKLAKAHSTMQRVVSVCLVVLSSLCLLLALLQLIPWAVAGCALGLVVLLNGKLLLFSIRKKGVCYFFEALFFEYLFSLAIGIGGIFPTQCKR